MTDVDPSATLDRVRLALNRVGAKQPLPPPLHEPAARRVYTSLGLPELFAHAAGAAAMLVHVDDLAAAIVGHLRDVDATAVTLDGSPLVRKVNAAAAVRDGGFRVIPADADVLIASCDVAVAETGCLAFRGGPPAAWSTARSRLVLVEPKNLVPDLIDLFALNAGDLTLVRGSPATRLLVLH